MREPAPVWAVLVTLLALVTFARVRAPREASGREEHRRRQEQQPEAFRKRREGADR